MSDYAHWFHAGNVGDVWKHCALLALLGARRPGPCLYVETHAGQGQYQLESTGEWTEGAGRLTALPGGTAPTVVRRYLDAIEAQGFRPEARGLRYPGSPLLALAALGTGDRAVLVELSDLARAALTEAVGADARARTCGGDGLAALADTLAGAAAQAEERLVMIDPPYTQKSEWTEVPAALLTAHRADPEARFLLWYPIKSLTRPNAMLASLQAGGLGATALELVTTPLELKRNRLNGSGLLLVNPPGGLVGELAAAAPFLGAACATHEGRWSTRGLSWG
jgi:23S rRNA (adenine2030-N6)-methyltransferase